MLFEYHITGSLREPLLIIEWAYALVCLQISIMLLIKYRKKQGRERSLQEMGHFSLFLGLSAMWYTTIIADYFVPEGATFSIFVFQDVNLRYFLSTISTVCITVGIIFFSYFMERRTVYLFKKYFFTILLIAAILVAGGIIVIDLGSVTYTRFIAIPVVLFFIVFYIRDTGHKLSMEKESTRKLTWLLPAFILIVVGYILSTEIVVGLIGILFRVIGSFVQVASSVCIFYFFLKVPSLSDLNWKRKLEHFFVMSKGGVCQLQTHFFHEHDDEDSMSEHLISSALASVNIMLQELTEAELYGFSVIKKKGKIVSIYSSKYVNGVIISTEEIDAIKFYLEKFIKQYEAIYQNVLENWDGNSEVFSPMKNLVNEMFII